MENYIKFLRGTPAAFKKLAVKDNNTLYFISEPGAKEGLLYLGEKLIAGGSASSITELGISGLTDVIIDQASLTDESILMFDWASKKWVNKTLDEIVVDVMTGATSTQPGAAGLVPTPKAGEQNKFLRGDGAWAEAGMSAQEKEDLSEVQTAVSSLIGDSANKDGSIPSVAEIATDVLTKALVPENAKESLDTLQEIAGWIQNHPDDASQMANDISNLQTVTGKLDSAINAENTGLIARVGVLEDILNDTTNEEGETTPGLVSVVRNLVANQITGDFVLNSTYKAEVGDLSKLLFSNESNSSIVDEINSINQRLSWVDMTE